MRTVIFMFLCMVVLSACQTHTTEDQPEAISLLGEPLHQRAVDETTRLELDANLAEAQQNYNTDPRNLNNIIWLGRRLSYLGRYRDAIDIYTKGLKLYPDDPELLRHRGHRHISVRQFDDAIADLSRAADRTRGLPDRIEPDGQPNDRNIPLSTLQTNIYYHVGLAHYLKGEFAQAVEAYRAGMALARNSDMQVAFAHWLYMSLRRLDRNIEASAIIQPYYADMDIIENHSYFALVMLYKTGDTQAWPSPAVDPITDAAYQYGLGNWHLYHGRTGQARDIFQQIIATDAWPAFGYIAAEAELARMQQR